MKISIIFTNIQNLIDLVRVIKTALEDKKIDDQEVAEITRKSVISILTLIADIGEAVGKPISSNNVNAIAQALARMSTQLEEPVRIKAKTVFGAIMRSTTDLMELVEVLFDSLEDRDLTRKEAEEIAVSSVKLFLTVVLTTITVKTDETTAEDVQRKIATVFANAAETFVVH